jgi:MoaA/NifB/PqqE/SkfB family radical SAM enzyme
VALSRVGKILRSSGWRIVTRPDVLYNRWLNERELAARAEFVRSAPSKIEIEITNRCNLSCRHCIRSKPGFEAWLGDISLDDFQKLLRQFPRTLTLTLTGFGEMMVHPRFLDIVASARQILPHANILGYTNGLLINQTVDAEDLVRSGIGQVHFSLDAATAETYQTVRCSPKFDQVIAAIRSVLDARRRLHSSRPFVGINFTMMNENFREAPDYVRLGAELGVDYIARPALIMTAWGYADGAKRITKAEMVDVLLQTRRAAEETRAPMALDGYMRDPADYFAHYDDNRKESFRTCFFLWNHIQIDPFGNLKLCCAHPAASIHSWGNLLETPFSEIWNSERLRTARRSLVRGIPPARACVETCLRPDPEFAD